MKNILEEPPTSSITIKTNDEENQRELFLNTLLHDIKNPLLAQIEGLKILKSGIEKLLNPEQMEILNLSLESSKYMQELLLSVLSIYKFEHGIITLQKRPFALSTLVEGCIKEVLVLARKRGVEIQYSVPKHLLLADEGQIRRVVSNLLTNAVTYCHKNSTISVFARLDGDFVVFLFQNYAPKISDEIAKNIFEKFVCAENKYKKVGSGLGMYLSRKIIEAHGGKIWLETEGELYKFGFKLPINSNAEGKVIFD